MGNEKLQPELNEMVEMTGCPDGTAKTDSDTAVLPCDPTKKSESISDEGKSEATSGEVNAELVESDADESSQTSEGEENPAEETVQPEKRFCAKCGVELLPDQKFCPKCGTGREEKVENNAAVEEFNKQLAESKKKRKKKRLLIFAVIIAVVGLGIGGKFAFTAIRHSVGISKANKTLAAYKTDQIDYDTAIAEITKIKAYKDTDVASHAADTEKSIEKLKASKDHFSKGELYKGKKEYKNAVSHYGAVIKDDPNYEAAQNAIKEIIPLWKESIPAEIDGLMKEKKTEDAAELIKTFLGYSQGDSDIANIGKFIEAEEFYAKGYLNSAQGVFEALPTDLAVNGITVKSRLDTLKKYAVFVKMCGKWKTTDYYMETKQTYRRDGSWDNWYRKDTGEANRYLYVTCVINNDGTVTVKGSAEYLCYTNYSAYKSNLERNIFTSKFSKKCSLPSDNSVSFSYTTDDLTYSGYTIIDNNTLKFNGSKFNYSESWEYISSKYWKYNWKNTVEFGTCVEKY